MWLSVWMYHTFPLKKPHQYLVVESEELFCIHRLVLETFTFVSKHFSVRQPRSCWGSWQKLIISRRGMKQLTAGEQHTPLGRTAVYYKRLSQFALILSGMRQYDGSYRLEIFVIVPVIKIILYVGYITVSFGAVNVHISWHKSSSTRSPTFSISLSFHTLWSCTSLWHYRCRDRTNSSSVTGCSYSKCKQNWSNQPTDFSESSKSVLALINKTKISIILLGVWIHVSVTHLEVKKMSDLHTETRKDFCKAISQVLNSTNLNMVLQTVWFTQHWTSLRGNHGYLNSRLWSSSLQSLFSLSLTAFSLTRCLFFFNQFFSLKMKPLI